MVALALSVCPGMVAPCVDPTSFPYGFVPNVCSIGLPSIVAHYCCLIGLPDRFATSAVAVTPRSCRGFRTDPLCRVDEVNAPTPPPTSISPPPPPTSPPPPHTKDGRGCRILALPNDFNGGRGFPPPSIHSPTPIHRSSGNKKKGAPTLRNQPNPQEPIPPVPWLFKSSRFESTTSPSTEASGPCPLPAPVPPSQGSQ